MITGYKVLTEGNGNYGEFEMKHNFFGVPKGIYFVDAEEKIAWKSLPENLGNLPSDSDSWGEYKLSLIPIIDAMNKVFSSANKKLLDGKLHNGEKYLATFPEGDIEVTPFGDIKINGEGYAIDEYDGPIGMSFKDTFNIKHLSDVIKVS